MTVEVECGRCGRKYILVEDSKGDRVRCVKCNGLMHIVDKNASIDNAFNGKNRRKTVYITAAIICAFLVISSGLAAAIVLPGAFSALREAKLERCRMNMENMAFALMNYTLAHDGSLPAHPDGELRSLSLLYPDYTDNPDIFWCPAVSLDDVRWFPENTSLMGQPCSYRYHSPGDDSANSPDIPVVTESDGVHGKPGGYSIMMDGRVEWIVLDEEQE